MKDRSSATNVEQTINRRTVLEWLGKAAVISLSSDLLLGCHDQESGQTTSDDARPAPAQNDGARDGMLHDSRPSDGFSFYPAEEHTALYDRWPVRTVDQQNLVEILASFQLTITGLVHTEQSYSFADLLTFPRQSQVTDFHCVEGWSVLDVPWDGLHLSKLLSAAQPQEAASHITFHTLGGSYNESLPLDIALEPHTLLAYGVAGATLPLNHGFPLRLVIPRLLGYKNAKYVERIELTDKPIEGYWVKHGYTYSGEVPSSRLRPGKY